MKKVLKFGGTSVGSAANMRKVAAIIRREGATLTVLSAMSGTTDALVKIGVLAKTGSNGDIPAVLDALRQKYTACIEELLGAARGEALQRTDDTFELIENEARKYAGEASDKVIQAQGELLTSFIFSLFLAESGERSTLLNAPDFMHTVPDGKVDTERLNGQLSKLAETPQYYVTQGFICTNADGALDNLGRGGSDYSAALMGVAIGADEVQIWTDIDGMHNNDPRFVDKTYPIRHMSFDDAAELAYFGAKILHPATMQPCKENGIPVRLKNTMDPDAPGTLITGEGDGGQFCAVAAKDGITVIRIHSTRMLMAYGFLRKVFEIFEEHRTAIDMITTSEVAVSLTIDNDRHLDAIVAELKTLGTIEIERGNTIVCVVGDLGYQKAGLIARVSGSLGTIPAKMLSYGASNRSLVMLIDTRDKIQALRNMNRELFNL